MGQITIAPALSATLTSVDRFIAGNAGMGVAVSALHLILLGENAGNNLPALTTGIIALGENAGSNAIAAASNSTFIGKNAGAGSVIPASIVIGQDSGKVTSVATPALNPTSVIVIGSGSLNGYLGSGGVKYAPIVIGNNVMPTWGNHPAQNNPDNFQQIAIGNDILALAQVIGSSTTNQPNIMIGNNIGGTSAGNPAGFTKNILIGTDVMARAITGAQSPRQNVVIGHNTYNTKLNTNGQDLQNVFVGNDITVPGTSTLSNCVAVGYGASMPTIVGVVNCTAIGAAALARNNYATIIGAACAGSATGEQNIVLGERAILSGAGFRQILIGQNVTYNSAINDQFAVANVNGFLMLGNMVTGNMHLGLGAANQDLNTIGCTNALKITTGTRGAGNPVGGGFFYFDAATGLRFVSPSGINTIVAPP